MNVVRNWIWKMAENGRNTALCWHRPQARLETTSIQVGDKRAVIKKVFLFGQRAWSNKLEFQLKRSSEMSDRLQLKLLSSFSSVDIFNVGFWFTAHSSVKIPSTSCYLGEWRTGKWANRREILMIWIYIQNCFSRENKRFLKRILGQG